MSLSQNFIDTITDLVRPLGHITVRKMFGGAGVYCDGQIFALLDDDVMYLKVDDQNRAAFVAEGCGPFEYPIKTGVQVIAAYHRAPERLLDEQDELLSWVKQSVAASRRTALAKPATKTKSPVAKASPMTQKKTVSKPRRSPAN